MAAPLPPGTGATLCRCGGRSTDAAARLQPGAARRCQLVAWMPQGHSSPRSYVSGGRERGARNAWTRSPRLQRSSHGFPLRHGDVVCLRTCLAAEAEIFAGMERDADLLDPATTAIVPEQPRRTVPKADRRIAAVA